MAGEVNRYFVGRKTLPETLKLVSESGIGLALYTGEWAFNEYGDSTKCREYGSYGLPILSTKHHATVDEIKSSGSGVVVGQDVEEYVSGITDIFENYDKFSKKSLAWGRRFSGAHAKLIKSILT